MTPLKRVVIAELTGVDSLLGIELKERVRAHFGGLVEDLW